MTGNHRAISDPSKARITVAGAFAAGALLLAPAGVALLAPGTAHADTAAVGNDVGLACAPGGAPACLGGTGTPTLKIGTSAVGIGAPALSIGAFAGGPLFGLFGNGADAA